MFKDKTCGKVFVKKVGGRLIVDGVQGSPRREVRIRRQGFQENKSFSSWLILRSDSEEVEDIAT
jgi:hypothetical protein